MPTAVDKYKALQGYMDEQCRFHSLPGKRQKKKQLLMFQYLAQQFELGKKYTEKEVNEILNLHHTFEDPASLRRLMFGSKLLDRTLDGRVYWRVSVG